MIRFEHVQKLYPPAKTALDNVSFHLQRGEIVFLTGHSGAGKSTILRLIMLLERPSSGEIYLTGDAITRIPKRQIPYYRRHIGFVHQDHRLLANHTVFDNVALPLRISGESEATIKSAVGRALDLVGLADKKHELPLILSGGEQQRVGIARAIVSRPPLLVADEPTGNLDPELSREIMNLFIDLNRAGVTVLIATHELTLVERIAKRRIDLKAGQLIHAQGV